VPAIPNVAGYAFASPNAGTTEATVERTYAARIASHISVDDPHLAFVNENAQAALATLDRVAAVGTYNGTVTYPANNALAQAFKAVAGAIVRGIGTKVFWVTTGGYDTHAAQNPNGGSYTNLMGTLNDAIAVFYNDLASRRITENGSAGTDHGAGSVMMAIGGQVKGGVYGTAPNLNPDPQNPTLENNGGDVRFETDFRSVYARIIDGWLGSNSVAVLGGDFRKSSLAFI
jgi:uncharacterized protein (DUF1501 family)